MEPMLTSFAPRALASAALLVCALSAVPLSAARADPDSPPLPSAAAAAPTLTILHTFGLNTWIPVLIEGKDGNLYGSTNALGGVAPESLFKLSPEGTYTTFHLPTGLPGPNGLMQATNGDFYGTTVYGGTGGSGTIFKMTPAGDFTVIFNFPAVGFDNNNADGAQPNGIIQASDGNFYGTTRLGGPRGNGTLFRCTSGGTLTTLYYFSKDVTGAGPDGALPQSLVTEGANGDLYGITTVGGAHEYGTIFRYSLATKMLATIYSWPSGQCDGCIFNAPFVLGANGLLYGISAGGGKYDAGSVLTISPDDAIETIFSFPLLPDGMGTDGESPVGQLIRGSDGNFYGTTAAGGTHGNGTIYKLTPSGALTTLYSFGIHGSVGPEGPLVEGEKGFLYGTTPPDADAQNQSPTIFGLPDAVAAVAPTYTLGGTVTGLTTGRSLELLDSGGHALELKANGKFTFAGSFANGSSYDVTVKTQPTGEACTVTKGTGKIDGADVTTIEVECKT
jgi:uncharacterized repeat protein (TIGR03803 family)